MTIEISEPPQQEALPEAAKVETPELDADQILRELGQVQHLNAELAEEGKTKISELIVKTTGELKNPMLSKEERARLGQEMANYRRISRDLEITFPAISNEKQVEARYDSALATTSEADRARLQELLPLVPDKLREKFLARIEGIEKGFQKDSNEVTKATATQGVIFELSRIEDLMKSQKETINFELQVPAGTYMGLQGKATAEARPKELPGEIDLDVPIERNGQPYVYEVKSHPRMPFGSTVGHRNQFLKYDQAIRQGRVDGATVEIRGRIDPDFLKWSLGESIIDEGAVPNVEMIYTLDLPSGQEFRFVLKDAIDSKTRQPREGLRFENQDAKYTTEDRRVINGVQRAIFDRSIINILTSTHLEGASEELARYAEDPMKIVDVQAFDTYQQARRENIHQKLTGREALINDTNEQSAYSEFAVPEVVERMFDDFQRTLIENPHMAKARGSYLVKDPETRQRVLSKALDNVSSIKAFEVQRQQSESEALSQQKRAEKGWRSNPEGVALDLFHISMDAIQEINKTGDQRGRTYEKPERFSTLPEIASSLDKRPSKRHIEAELYDPQSGEVTRPSAASPKSLGQLAERVLDENLRRLTAKYQELTSQGFRREIGQLADSIPARAAEFEEKMRLAKLESQQTKDFTEMKKLAQEKQVTIQGLKEQLRGLYVQSLGREAAAKVEQRITKILDQDIMKFIYVVNSEEQIKLDEEVVRGGKVTGRAAHSELAQGRNIYGAGELVFEKHNQTFSSVEAWREFNDSMQENAWQVAEINNGSGHYRPNAETLEYVRTLMSEQGLDVSQAKLRDAILRGVKIPDLEPLG